jgi:hypothetical protein
VFVLPLPQTLHDIVTRFSWPATVLLAVSVFAASWPLAGQEAPTASADALRVFFDCGTWNCREDRIRQEIEWVTWVREPQDGDVYLLVTGQRAGSGGFQYTFDFEGRGDLEAAQDRLVFTSNPTDVEEEIIAGLIQTVSAGLVRYVALSGRPGDVRIEGVAMGDLAANQEAQVPESDPWNFWVFNTQLEAQIDREDRERQDRYEVNFSANRTTDAWKIDIGGRFDYRRREVEFEEGEPPFVDEREDWNVGTLVVKSLGDHWSTGFYAEAGKSVRFNRDFGYEISPAVEWNYFPWDESTRRRFVILYTAGVLFRDYEEVTIFDKTEETLLQHRLDLSFRLQESWGEARFGVEGRQYLQYLDEFSIELRGDGSYRLIRGLGLDIGVNYEVIRDQRFLSGEGLSPEEILISRRELGTGSRFGLEVGISYRFGSIFNTIVNQRFLSFD